MVGVEGADAEQLGVSVEFGFISRGEKPGYFRVIRDELEASRERNRFEM